MKHINYFLSKNLVFDEEIMHAIEKIAAWNKVHSVSVFPDLHPKTGEMIPTGVVFATDNYIYPAVIKTNFNCGIGIFKTSLKYNEVGAGDIKLVFDKLVDVFSDRKHKYWNIKNEDLDNILFRGVDWVRDRFGLDEADQMNIENNGSFFKGTDFSMREVMRNIPRDAYKGGIEKLGLMWVGNHFLEMNKVEKILDRNIAGILGLGEGEIVFMVHGDSGALGARISKYFMCRDDENLKSRSRKKMYHLTLNPQLAAKRNNLYFRNHYPPVAIKADSPEARRYISCAYAAINYGFVNRVLAYKLITDILKKHIREDAEIGILIDVSHKIIKRENIKGKTFWVHRNGASRAYGPSLMKGHPVYSKTGQPLPLPGSMTAGSYICVAQDKVSQSLFSVNHGTGRKTSIKELEKNISNEGVYDMLKKEDVYIKRMGKGAISEYSPTGYKDLEEVMQVIRDLGLVKPVVKLKPLGVLKG